MKKYLLTLTLCSFSIVLNAQDLTFEQGMKKGFDTFMNGETYDLWVAGAESLATLSEEYPDEWLGYYWASYMYTQIARSAKRDSQEINPKLMLDNAQKYLDLASKRIKDKTPVQEVDIHMLQYLTYSFRKRFAEDQEKYDNLMEVEMKAAMRKHPNHPILLVGAGLDLFFKGDYKSVYAARILLLKAKELISNRLQPRYMSTQYIEQWIGYWEPQTKKKLLELTQD